MTHHRLAPFSIGCLAVLFLIASALPAAAAVLKTSTGYFIDVNHRTTAYFKAGTEATFRPDGSVSAGTLLSSGGYYIDEDQRFTAYFAGGTAITFRDNGSVSAGTLLHHSGYFIDENFWNKGIASSAVKLIEHIGFNELNLERIEIMMIQGNIGSIRVAEKCGYKREGLLSNRIFNDGKYHDAYLYAKLKTNINPDFK